MVDRPPQPSALVLGAGIQGVAVALALSAAGWRVEVVDQASAAMLGTSLRGEGKLHLGYVYGNDPDRKTAALMVQGALSFGPLLDRWLPEPLDWPSLRSEPYAYAVLADSMVSASQLAEHYRWVDQLVAERIDAGNTYAGASTVEAARQLVALGNRGLSGDVVAAFLTSEIAIDPQALRSRLLAGLDGRRITLLLGRVVREVQRATSGFVTTMTDRSGGVSQRRTDVVVNCLWDGRLAIDATMGIQPKQPCLYRLKYGVWGRIPASQAIGITTTFVLGPFGDVVSYGGGRVYLSWYPSCMVGMSAGDQPPPQWQEVLSDVQLSTDRQTLAAETVGELAHRIPALKDLKIEAVRAGVVVAWGDSDIDQRSSELHQRHAIGVHDHDGYLSVDTGKSTTAPLFAQHLVDVLGQAPRTL